MFSPEEYAVLIVALTLYSDYAIPRRQSLILVKSIIDKVNNDRFIPENKIEATAEENLIP